MTFSWRRKRHRGGAGELPLEYLRFPGHGPALSGAGWREWQLRHSGPDHGLAVGAEEHKKLQYERIIVCILSNLL